MEKLEGLGFQNPKTAPESIQQRLEQIYANIIAQYEQTKDVVWCCLDEPADGEERLEPTDAFHAITSELNGLVLQVSQVHRLYQQQLLEQTQIAETLQQQLILQSKQQHTPERKDMASSYNEQFESLAKNHREEVQELRQLVETLQIRSNEQRAQMVQLEKENLLLKAEKLIDRKTEGDDDIVVRRVIFQRDMLEMQVRNLEQQKNELDSQMMTYNALIELAKADLGGKGIDQQILLQLHQTVQNLSKVCAEYDRERLETQKLRIQVQELQGQLDSIRDEHKAEKIKLKKEWGQIFSQICQQLGVTL